MLCMLGDKCTVQFYQDGVEHIVSLQDMKPQKVCREILQFLIENYIVVESR